ncbi:MAG: YfhO family protein [Clostridiales bacterium]|nr:YfhO family protein [Clostridiales bacterium]
MRKSSASRRYYITGLIAVFLISCFIVSAVILLCRNTEPGKIIPSELTSRHSNFDEDIIGNIKSQAADCREFKRGTLNGGIILDEYCDPFFFAGSILPESSLEAFFTTVYVIKIGLAAAVMYSFLRRRLALKRTFAMLIGLTYALSSRVIFVSSLSQGMNVVILIPVALSLIYEAVRKKTLLSHVFAGALAFLMCISGTAGTLSGTLFIISSSLIVSLALTPSVRKALASWGRILLASFAGVLCAAIVIVPRFVSYGMTYDFMKLIDERKVYYSFFDMLSTMFTGSGGSLDYSAVPTVYFGILPLMLLILFFFNRKIPARLKFASLILIALTHISCAVSIVDLTLSFFGYSSVITDLRLIGLCAVICLLAAICLVNLDGLSDTAVLAGGVAPVLAIILFNGLGGAVSYNITSLYLPGLVIIILTLLIYRKRKDFLPGKYLYPVFAAGLAFIFFNTFVIYATGSVEPGDVSASFVSEVVYDRLDLISDREISLFNSDNEKYIVFPAEEAAILDNSILPVFINSVSRSITGERLFEQVDFDVKSEDGIRKDDNGYFTAYSDSALLTIGVDRESGEDIYLYVGFDGPNDMDEDDGEAEDYFGSDGAFLKQITCKGRHVDISLSIDDRDQVTAPIEVLKLRPDVLTLIEEKTQTMTQKNFLIDPEFVFEGDNYLLTNIPYDEDYVVYVNNDKVITYSVQNLLAVRFESNGSGQDVDVRISKVSIGQTLGIYLSMLGAALTVALIFIRKVIEKKKSGNAILDPKKEGGKMKC